MLTHWNELLVRVATPTWWWHVLLEQLALDLILVIVKLTDCSVVVFVAGASSI